jgi:hypothetical protein
MGGWTFKTLTDKWTGEVYKECYAPEGTTNSCSPYDWYAVSELNHDTFDDWTVNQCGFESFGNCPPLVGF